MLTSTVEKQFGWVFLIVCVGDLLAQDRMSCVGGGQRKESGVWTWLSDERFGWKRTSSVLKLEWIRRLQEGFRELDQHLEQVVVVEAPAVESGSFARVDSDVQSVSMYDDPLRSIPNKILIFSCSLNQVENNKFS